MSVTNQAVQSQMMARGLKLWIKKLEGLFYLCSEMTRLIINIISYLNKGIIDVD